MKNQIANIITGSRILCSILILFCPVFSVWFYAVKNWDGGTKWQSTTLMSMLENEKYKG